MIAFLVYLRTLSPGLHFGDGPEFATAAHVLGIPHPTGYPLYILLLKLWLILTVGGEVILRTTLFNAVCMAAAAGLATGIVLDLLRAGFPGWSDKSRLIAAACGALGGAFLRFHWSNAVVTEVYALQFLLTLGFVRSLQLFVAAREGRFIAMAAMFLGLALANHRMSLFLVLPFFTAWAVAWRGRWLSRWRRPALLSTAAIAAGLALYLYLPLRAAARPPLNWGNPTTPARFFDHVQGGRFVEQRFLRPSATDPTRRFSMETYTRFVTDEIGQIVTDFAGQVLPVAETYQLNRFVGRLFAQPTVTGGVLFSGLFLLAIGGGVRLFRTAPLVAGIIALIAVQNIVLLFLYNIIDIQDYYLFPFWAGWICSFAGILVLADPLVMRAVAAGHRGVLGAWILLGIPLVVLAGNWRRADRSWDFHAEVLAANLLPESHDLMPPGSVVLTASDYDIFPLWYAQLVRGTRPDVLVVGGNFLNEPWYSTQFTPEQIARYGLEFSRTIPRGPEGYARQLSKGVIDENLGKRAIFINTLFDPPTLQELGRRYSLRPVVEAPVLFPGNDQLTTVALVKVERKDEEDKGPARGR